MTSHSGKSAASTSWVEHAADFHKKHRESGKEERVEPQISVIVFEVNNEHYAAPIECIKEVVKTPPISVLPQTTSHYAGLANIRGNIMSMIDLEAHVESKKADIKRPFTLVLQDPSLQSGVLIDHVPETIKIFENQIDRSSIVMKNLTAHERFITGLIKHQDKMIILIDLEKMIHDN